MTWISFNEVKIYGTKSGICPVCKKPAKRQKKFFQTLNPFNKNKNGLPKNREEILKELAIKENQWKKEPVYHAKCEAE